MNQSNSLRWSQLILIVLFLAAAHFLVDVMLGIWPLYKSMAKLDMALSGLIVGLGAFIGEGSQLFFGSFSDKGYRKLLIIIGLIMAMGGSFFAYSTDYVVLFFLYLLTSIGSGCFHPCAASLTSGLIPSRRGLLLTIFAAMGSLGMATSQLIFSSVYSFFEGGTYLLAIPAIALGIIFACYRLPKAVNQAQIDTSHAPPSLSDFKHFFQNKPLLNLYLSQVGNQSLMWGTIFILPDALKSLGHSEWICCGGGHCCLILGAAFMMVPGGYLADIYSVRRIMLYGGFISAISFYWFLLSNGNPAWLVLLNLFILGSTLSVMNPLAVSLGTKMEPLRTGSVSAFLMGMVWCVSEPLGPGGLGIMSGMFEENGPVKALAILGSLFVLQIYGTYRLPHSNAHTHQANNLQIIKS